MIHDDLLRVGRDLASTKRRGSLRQAYLRRSISSSYYALFHALARLCADELIGASKSSSVSWLHVYRALDHSQAKNVLIELAREFDEDGLSLLSEAFAALQQARHQADYDPERKFHAGEAGAFDIMARLATAALAELHPNLKVRLATLLVVRKRR